MSEFRVASRYAKSLITLARDQGVLEEVNQDMLLFASVCRQNRDFVLMLDNPIIPNEKKATILVEIFQDKVHPTTMAFFGVIARKNREMLLPVISDEFHYQYNEWHGISMAKVTTVFPLDESLRMEFKNLTGHFTGKNKVELEEEVDQSLIGGYLLKLEGKQVDESLRGKLKELSLKFS